jgi:hypothetical protein
MFTNILVVPVLQFGTERLLPSELAKCGQACAGDYPLCLVRILCRPAKPSLGRVVNSQSCIYASGVKIRLYAIQYCQRSCRIDTALLILFCLREKRRAY